MLKLDDRDIAILKVLAAEGRITKSELAGRVGLSASYLNLSELLDRPVLDRMVRRAADYGASIDVSVESAMTADVNGHGQGLARALLDNGVRNLFSCVHTQSGPCSLVSSGISYG